MMSCSAGVTPASQGLSTVLVQLARRECYFRRGFVSRDDEARLPRCLSASFSTLDRVTSSRRIVARRFRRSGLRGPYLGTRGRDLESRIAELGMAASRGRRDSVKRSTATLCNLGRAGRGESIYSYPTNDVATDLMRQPSIWVGAIERQSRRDAFIERTSTCFD